VAQDYKISANAMSSVLDTVRSTCMIHTSHT